MRITSWEAEWEEEREARTGPVVLCVGSVFRGGEWQIRRRFGGYWSDAVAQASWWEVMNNSVCLRSKDKFDKMTCSHSGQLVSSFDHIWNDLYLHYNRKSQSVQQCSAPTAFYVWLWFCHSTGFSVGCYYYIFIPGSTISNLQNRNCPKKIPYSSCSFSMVADLAVIVVASHSYVIYYLPHLHYKVTVAAKDATKWC